MPIRSTLVILSSAIGCTVLVGCIVLLVLVGTAFAVPNLVLAVASPVDRIVYIDNNFNVQSVNPQGTERRALTTDASVSEQRIYMYPAWSPDSQRIAFIGTTNTSTLQTALYTVSPAGTHRATVFSSSTQAPFYLYWSPNSQQIGFLAQSASEMALMLGQADGNKQAQKLETGSPFYWAWSPDSQSMLMHIGGSRHNSSNAHLAVLRWQESISTTALARGPSDFEAPQFSPDGKMILYAGTADADNDALYLADAKDANASIITTFNGRIAFAWSPDGKKIAWIITDPDSGLPNLGTVFISNADGKNAKALTTEDALAFYWSPNSQQIAYLALPSKDTLGCAFDCGRVPGFAAPLAQDQTVKLRWRVANLADGHAHTIATFVPTDEFISELPYFDQYARSMTFWSPDSQKFVYTDSDQDSNGTVWVANAITNTAPIKIGEGTIAVWSWR